MAFGEKGMPRTERQTKDRQTDRQTDTPTATHIPGSLNTKASAVPLDRANEDGEERSSVSIGPANPSVTSTPCGNSSLLSELAKDDRKALLAVYTATSGPGPTEAMFPTMRIRAPVSLFAM